MPSSRKWHGWFDRLSKSVVALLVLVGLLYVSAYATGWPSLPDPDNDYRHSHGLDHEHRCRALEAAQ